MTGRSLLLDRCCEIFLVVAMSGIAAAQCYDLSSAQLYSVKGRFQERWDRPIWDAKPGEGNFNLDESPWFGGIQEFVIFSIGQVQKTGSGWVPVNKSDVPDTWCEPAHRTTGARCYWVPYQTPPPQATRQPRNGLEVETWSLSNDGILRYTRRNSGYHPFDRVTDYGPPYEATLDLNNGAFSAVLHSHSQGTYRHRFPGGIEMWRDTTLSAKVKLVPQTCPVNLQHASVPPAGSGEVKRSLLPICVAREKTGAAVEFLIDPLGASTPSACIVLHEGPMPVQDSTTVGQQR